MSAGQGEITVAEQRPAPVNVARLRAADRSAAVVDFVGEMVDVTAKWGSGPETHTSHRGRAVAVALVYGEGGMAALVLHTDTGRVLAIKMTRLQRIALAGSE
jgi:hypothetical protein